MSEAFRSPIGKDRSGKAVIQVYLDKITPQATAAAPAEMEGTPVKLVETGGGIVPTESVVARVCA